MKTHWIRLLWLLFGCLGMGVWPTVVLAAEGVTLIRIKGSDTLTKALKEWVRVYQEREPGVRFEVSGGGSGNGIAALINGHVEVASSSRLLREREWQLFRKKNAHVVPVEHVVARDAVSVVVHPSNPINGVSLQQLTDIYSKSSQAMTWTELGVQVPGCPEQKILPIGRKNNSGTYLFFRQTILDKHDQFDSQKVSTESADAIVAMVAQAPCAIGYSGTAFVTNAVKTLCVSKDHAPNAPCVPPTMSATVDQVYPLARSLYLYTMGEPAAPLKKFLVWIQGREGREILTRNGYIPPP
ncbi:MAG: phosphate ABC transporter substrate-binding protein [Magnetococcales bacterium]|nr:phosphate ABC transporter substrate-binding protein [Magnetococcales bacterium]NGZ05918.1 phosphate ABC transporter substrate-binding protein [Magnetococcales bacterium]